LSRTLHIEAAGLSSRGRAHTDNQDAFAVFPELGLFVVADGIGGRPAGGVASALALAAVRAALGGDARAPASLLLRAAVEEANQRILATAEGDPAKSGMGATFTGALMRGERVAIAHVGDSRAYLLHARRLDRLTEDHILANDGIWGALDLAERAKLGRDDGAVPSAAWRPAASTIPRGTIGGWPRRRSPAPTPHTKPHTRAVTGHPPDALAPPARFQGAWNVPRELIFVGNTVMRLMNAFM